MLNDCKEVNEKLNERLEKYLNAQESKNIFTRIRYSIRSFKWDTIAFFDKIIKTIKWIPIIWKTRDFSYAYAFDLYTKQLLTIAEGIEERSYVADANKIAKEIRLAVKLISCSFDEETYKVVERFEEKYGPRDLKSDNLFKSIPDSDYFEFVNEQNWKRLYSEEEYERITTELQETLKLRGSLVEKWNKKGYLLIAKRHKTWWD